MKYDLTAPRDMPLSDLLAEKLSFLGRRALACLIKDRQVKVNGSRVGGDVPLSEGDGVEVYTSAALPEIRVIYADDSVVIADKPSHIDTMSLPSVLAAGYGELYPVHRLDVNTTGLVALARTPEAKAEMEREFKARTVKKKYTATVVGAPPKPRGVMKHWLVKDAKTGRVKAYDRPVRGGLESEAAYELLESDGELSKLMLYPSTGRTHQLRVQLAATGMPILGDGKYGDFAANKKYKAGEQRLRAVSLTFTAAAGAISHLRGKEFRTE